jgi:hypothetical protein
VTDFHAAWRDAVLAGDPGPDANADLAQHLADCTECAELAVRVATVRRLAPTLGTAPVPADLGDRLVASLRRTDAYRTTRRRRVAHVLLPRLAIAAAVIVLFGVLVASDDGSAPGGEDVDLSDALLVSAEQTEAAGSARLRLEGVATVATADGTRVRIGFGGVGELSADRTHYRGVARFADVIVPYELTTIGPDTWTRRADGTWFPVRERVGALAPVVLDAGSVLQLLRLPKADLELVASTDELRLFRFEVTPRSGPTYRVHAAVGTDDVLRRVDLESDAGGCQTKVSMVLYGLGEPVAIHRPAAADIGGTWAPPAAMPVVALFPSG